MHRSPRSCSKLSKAVRESAARHAYLDLGARRQLEAFKGGARVIESTRNEVLVSAASAWEIAVKQALGRLKVPGDLQEAVDAAGFTRKPIGFAEASRLSTLPLIHDDPFDRMLIPHARKMLRSSRAMSGL